MTDWRDYHSGQQVDALAKLLALSHHVTVGGLTPITVVWFHLISVQNTAIGFNVKGRQEKVTDEWVGCCSGNKHTSERVICILVGGLE